MSPFENKITVVNICTILLSSQLNAKLNTCSEG